MASSLKSSTGGTTGHAFNTERDKQTIPINQIQQRSAPPKTGVGTSALVSSMKKYGRIQSRQKKSVRFYEVTTEYPPALFEEEK